MTREWLHIGNIRRLGHSWKSVQDAMLDRDPFQRALPCWHPDSFIHVTISYYNCD